MISTLLLACLTLSSPYPIDPVYLKELIERSDIIVYGIVVDSKVIETEDDHFAEVTIEVDEELKRGLANKSLVKVHHQYNMMCPSPATYTKGRKVIAFLYKGKV